MRDMLAQDRTGERGVTHDRLTYNTVCRWVELCEDAPLCGVRSCAESRLTRTQQATDKCENLVHFLPQINHRNPLGAPARHSEEKPSQV